MPHFSVAHTTKKPNCNDLKVYQETDLVGALMDAEKMYYGFRKCKRQHWSRGLKLMGLCLEEVVLVMSHGAENLSLGVRDCVNATSYYSSIDNLLAYGGIYSIGQGQLFLLMPLERWKTQVHTDKKLVGNKRPP